MYVTTLVDPDRLQQLSLLFGIPRPFYGSQIITAQDDTCWSCARIGGRLFAIPSDRVNSDLSFGPIAERVCWLVHAEVRSRRTSEIEMTREELRQRLWGNSVHRNWLAKLRNALKSLSKLRLGIWSDAEQSPPLTKALPLFDEISEDPGEKLFIFSIGEGFLGSLEQFAVGDSQPPRYEFHDKKKLQSLRKGNQLADLYLPVYLGDPAVCQTLSSRQKRLLQAIIRELTFPGREAGVPKKAPENHSLEGGELIRGALIRNYNGKGVIECPDLDGDIHNITFGGNGVRRGLGYRFATWRERGGYDQDETGRFLDDLQLLGERLGLTIGAIDKSSRWLGFGRLRVLANSPARKQDLLDLHLRIYARADCFDRWNQLFGWDKLEAIPDQSSNQPESLGDADILDKLREFMAQKGLQQQHLAKDLGVSKQHLSKVLRRGKCSPTLRKRIEDILDRGESELDASVSIPDVPPLFVLAKTSQTSILNTALEYHDRGWVIIPAQPGTKKPYVKWKRFQTERPTREQVSEWWETWPTAGIAVVLGPVSNLMCVDVDGKEPHRILLDLLGEIPLAPTVKSGSEDPFRYHLYFQHPNDVATGASKTPWNEPGDAHKLELRGEKGILVLPPSLHKSGREYGWVQDRTPHDIPLPPVPAPLLEGLLAVQENSVSPLPTDPKVQPSVELNGIRVAPSTAEFLTGSLAEANGHWNNRLFHAACDLHGRGIPREQATQLLIQAAGPRTIKDQEIARDSIASAFSSLRTPSRY